MNKTYDVVIIGGGILGLASGMTLLQRYPKAKIALLEKEPRLAAHQTGNNSGVIHSGIYYAPGSHKAKLTYQGAKIMVEFCRQHEIAHEMCGKVIIATEPEELPLLEQLNQRGVANGLQLRALSKEAIREIEPHCRGLAGVGVSATGIVDYRKVAEVMGTIIQRQDGAVFLATKAERIQVLSDHLRIETNGETLQAKALLNCAGLYSDRIARLMGLNPRMRIIPIRGEYYLLRSEKRHLVKNLIYPVPNPNYPFLGVHFTRMINGEVHAGPNAVLSFKREGYSKASFDVGDSRELFLSSAFWKFARQNWREGAKEMRRSLSRKLFARSLQKFIPEISVDDLMAPHAGVRAQALGDDGRLLNDFVIIPGPRSIHVCNAPSPAATASLAIASVIVDSFRDLVI